MIEASPPSPFGEWLPDLGNFDNSGALIMKNVICEGDRYKPFPEQNIGSEAVPAMVKGGFAYRDASGNITIFCATREAIYKLDGTAWVEVTRGIGTTPVPYTTSADGFWCFKNYGTLVIGTNYNDDMQVYNVATDTEFSQLSSTAPRCRTFFIFKNFVVTLDTVDGDGAVGYRVRWSPLGDPQGDWTDIELQADFQDIYGGDFANVYGASLEDYAVIVQGREIWRMDYTGPSSGIMSLNSMDVGTGSLLPRGCIENGDFVFMIAEDGFYKVDANGAMPVGDGKIDKWFYENLDESFDYNINLQVDQLKKNILVAFPDKTANDGIPNKIICYNWARDRFTLIEHETECLFTFLSVGYTLDGLDALYTDLDLIPFSLDSRIWTGGKTILGCFTPDHELAAFNGPAKTAYIGTTQLRLNISGRATLHSLIPYIEGVGAVIRGRAYYKDVLNSAETVTDWVNQNSMTGEIDILQDSAFFRAEFEISGQWQIASAVAFRAAPAGQA
jgi:hypothetical protein